MGQVCLLAVPLLQCQSSLCLYPENTLSLWCFYRESLWLQRFLLVDHMRVEFAPSSLCMESKAFLKSTNSIVACSLFAHTPSRIIRIVNICEVVDLFLRKPFWFFLRMLSILSFMWLCSRALYILAAMDVSVIPR